MCHGKINERTISFAFGIWNSIDNRVPQSGRGRREKVVEAAVRIADLFEECFLRIMTTRLKRFNLHNTI